MYCSTVIVAAVLVTLCSYGEAQTWPPTSRSLGSSRTSAGIPSMRDTAGYLNKTAILPKFMATRCVGDRMLAQCPGNYLIKVKTGFYGREDNVATCVESGVPYRTPRGRTCKSTRAYSIVKNLCDGMKECNFKVDEIVFGSGPCSNVRDNYLYVEYDCELPVYTATTCEGESFHPSCMAGLEMQIVASYGRADRSTCPISGRDRTRYCAAEDATNKISALCNGREWCAVLPGDNYFGAVTTCPTTSKYIKAEFTCAKCANEYGDDGLCAAWQKAGECDKENNAWMWAYCRKACTQCGSRGNCLNVASDENCFDWAYKGECHKNADYMTAWCPNACNQCPEDGNMYVPIAKPGMVVYTPKIEVASGYERVRACPKQDALLSCPAGKHIFIKEVFYGRREGGNCMSGVGDAIRCESNSTVAGKALVTAQGQCNGRQTCYLYADSPPFADPCPGAETNRYLDIDFECRTCEDKPNAPEECAYWASWFECEKNFLWMPDMCYKACSMCERAERCDNVKPTSDCDYWASYGECNRNSDWMKENCAKSCRYCKAA